MEFYTLRDVSEMLHVSMTTIYRYVKEGRLTPAKIGNSYRVTEEDLREFVDRGKAATRARRAEKAVSSGSATRVSPQPERQPRRRLPRRQRQLPPSPRNLNRRRYERREGYEGFIRNCA